MKHTFKILVTYEEMLPFYGLITQLQPELTLAQYQKNLKHMIEHKYRMVVLYELNEVVAVSGIWVASKLYCGKYIEMDNVVVDEKHRGKGLGKTLVDIVVQIGRDEGCLVAMLDAYLENKGAHVFYEREGFVKKGFHFIRKIYVKK